MSELVKGLTFYPVQTSHLVDKETRKLSKVADFVSVRAGPRARSWNSKYSFQWNTHPDYLKVSFLVWKALGVVLSDPQREGTGKARNKQKGTV